MEAKDPCHGECPPHCWPTAQFTPAPVLAPAPRGRAPVLGGPDARGERGDRDARDEHERDAHRDAHERHAHRDAHRNEHDSGAHRDLPDVPMDREATILAELAQLDPESGGHVTFQGLRRRLGLHQQVLTRSLKRLERDGFILRDEKGYQPTEAGAIAAGHAPLVDTEPREVLTLVQALLPPNVAHHDVVERLGHRWFQGLRWYGESEAPGESTLTWHAGPENTRVVARVAGGALTLEVEIVDGRAEDGFLAVRALVSAIAELYGAHAPATTAPATTAAPQARRAPAMRDARA